MNEAVRPRFAVDLDEIERQLAQAPSAPASPTPVSRNDPLAELARIVGQEDPFQSLLGADKSRSQAKDPAGLDDLFVAQDRSGRTQAPARQDFRGSYDPGPARPADRSAHPAPANAYAGYEPQQTAGHDPYAPPPYDDGTYGDEYYQENGTDEYPPMEDTAYRPVQRGRSRKGAMALGALLGTVAVVGGGFWLLGGSSGMLSSGEPPLITANNEPVKVQPQSPGGLEIPNQNKQIYERADHDAQTQVVNREEQPVDVRQAVRAGSAAEPPGATAQPANTGGLNLGEPRRVRTVAIRPDGSIIGPEGAAGRPAEFVPPPASIGLPSATQVQPPPAQRPAASAVPAPPRMILPEFAMGGSSPQAPAPQAEPQRVASVQPTEIAPDPAPAPAATGGFAVQLAVSASESDAQAIFGRLQDKYADLSGQSPIIRKAEVNGRTLYRVRVGPMSRDDASSLCSKLQGQGGECFVARN